MSGHLDKLFSVYLHRKDIDDNDGAKSNTRNSSNFHRWLSGWLRDRKVADTTTIKMQWFCVKDIVFQGNGLLWNYINSSWLDPLPPSFPPPPPPPSLLSSIPSLKVPPVCRCYCTFGERRAFPVGDLTDSTLLSSHCVFRRGRLSRISILLQQVKETCILIKYLVTRNKVEFSINFQQSYHASI